MYDCVVHFFRRPMGVQHALVRARFLPDFPTRIATRHAYFSGVRRRAFWWKSIRVSEGGRQHLMDRSAPARPLSPIPSSRPRGLRYSLRSCTNPPIAVQKWCFSSALTFARLLVAPAALRCPAWDTSVTATFRTHRPSLTLIYVPRRTLRSAPLQAMMT
jgi:hypothetical protein